MMLHFVGLSKCVEIISLSFFETNHGQSEGNSMHSFIEHAVKQVGEIIVPSQLVTICKMAKQPYSIFRHR